MIENIDRCEPIIKDENKDKPEEKWYCFSPKPDMGAKQFTEELDRVIESYEKTH